MVLSLPQQSTPTCSSRGLPLQLSCPASLATRTRLWGRSRHGRAEPVAGANGNASSNGVGSSRGMHDDDDYPIELPTRFELMQRPDKQKPLVRVRLSVHYRVHSRQILCIGGSQIPLGWSFLSIAKVPMTWNSGDIWTCEVGPRAENVSCTLSCPAHSSQRDPGTRRSSCKRDNVSSTSMSSLRSR